MIVNPPNPKSHTRGRCDFRPKPHRVLAEYAVVARVGPASEYKKVVNASLGRQDAGVDARAQIDQVGQLQPAPASSVTVVAEKVVGTRLCAAQVASTKSCGWGCWPLRLMRHGLEECIAERAVILSTAFQIGDALVPGHFVDEA